MEGLYKISYYGSARKKDKDEAKEESKTYVTEEYNVKQNKVCSKELL